MSNNMLTKYYKRLERIKRRNEEGAGEALVIIGLQDENNVIFMHEIYLPSRFLAAN